VPFHLLGKLKRVFNSWRNLRGDACRRPFVDPCHLIEMHLTDLSRVKDRKLIAHWDEFNQLEVLQQIAAATVRKAKRQ
jgi:hypothetical protein